MHIRGLFFVRCERCNNNKKKSGKLSKQEHRRWLLSMITFIISLLLTRASTRGSIPPPPSFPSDFPYSRTALSPYHLSSLKAFPKPRFLFLTEAELDGIRHTELNTMVLVEHSVSYICLRRNNRIYLYRARSGNANTSSRVKPATPPANMSLQYYTDQCCSNLKKKKKTKCQGALVNAIPEMTRRHA